MEARTGTCPGSLAARTPGFHPGRQGSIPCRGTMREWWNGRHSGFKSRRPNRREGSTPSFRTCGESDGWHSSLSNLAHNQVYAGSIPAPVT